MTKGKWIAASIGAFVLVAALMVGGFAFNWFTAEPRGALEAREQILGSGDFRIQAYDRFFNQCAAIQSDEGRIQSLQTELETTNPSPSRVGQINASLTAIRSSRLEKINEYNADAGRNYTVGQFRDSDLPYNIDPNNEGPTECVLGE